MANQSTAALHHEIQLRNKIRLAAKGVQDIMLQTPGAVDIPKRLARQIFGIKVIACCFQTDGIFVLHADGNHL